MEFHTNKTTSLAVVPPAWYANAVFLYLHCLDWLRDALGNDDDTQAKTVDEPLRVCWQRHSREENDADVPAPPTAPGTDEMSGDERR